MEFLPMGCLKDYLLKVKPQTNLNTLLSYSAQICQVRFKLYRFEARLPLPISLCTNWFGSSHNLLFQVVVNCILKHGM